jgi:YD repeat-containing protein
VKVIKGALLAGLTASFMLGSTPVNAATASYQYDALGRLTQFRYDTGKAAIYYYDAAGNRSKVVPGTLTGVPSSITVPTSSTTGNYTVS